ncbi:hypothetical protein [Fischerella thermalis]|uniref:hypothetical protein n=1 Tax=Fischerella thermalis TaxID=372787 RepID=UPI0015E0811C|nr:hypothetical protein [Fischerella thermalis]
MSRMRVFPGINSSSVTVTVVVPLVKPDAVAVKVTVCVPSAIASSTAATSKVTEVCPAGISTVIEV